MKPRSSPRWLAIILALGLTLVLAPGFTGLAQATTEDVAMFYNELAPYGNWVDYPGYGQVWYPTQVVQDWRPYVDGRWVPTDIGYIFETQEPWGWATYHYGNWMPTTEYSWVWVPGNTWYPSTVAWRSTPDSTPVKDSYVGWAPVPPPNYVPPAEYPPPEGYYPGAPPVDMIPPPAWTYVPGPSFLPGYGMPYAPAYSYGGCGCLAPPFFPLFASTFLLDSFFFNPFYPWGVFGFGPGFPWAANVTNININNFNNDAHHHHPHDINNGLPPTSATDRNIALKQSVPSTLAQGGQLPGLKQASLGMAKANLAKPYAANPKNAPSFNNQFAKTGTAGQKTTTALSGTGRTGARTTSAGAAKGLSASGTKAPGMSLPASAVQKSTATAGTQGQKGLASGSGSTAGSSSKGWVASRQGTASRSRSRSSGTSMARSSGSTTRSGGNSMAKTTGGAMSKSTGLASGQPPIPQGAHQSGIMPNTLPGHAAGSQTGAQSSPQIGQKSSMPSSHQAGPGAQQFGTHAGQSPASPPGANLAAPRPNTPEVMRGRSSYAQGGGWQAPNSQAWQQGQPGVRGASPQYSSRYPSGYSQGYSPRYGAPSSQYGRTMPQTAMRPPMSAPRQAPMAPQGGYRAPMPQAGGRTLAPQGGGSGRAPVQGSAAPRVH